MSDAKHTPGPWTDQTDDGSQWGIYDRHGRCVAQAQQVAPLTNDYTQEERTANARLLSKAPEMFDLLLYGLRNFEQAGGDYELNADEIVWVKRTAALCLSLKGRS